MSLLALTFVGACSSAGTPQDTASASLGGSSSDGTGVVVTTGTPPDPGTSDVSGVVTTGGGDASDSQTGTSGEAITSSPMDFGSASDTDGTTGDDSASSTGEPVPPPVCGDGNVDEGEVCDAGDGNAENGACTLMCQAAVCGDGLVQAGVEECDDGNAADDDLCVAGCKQAACGDGFVGPGEACDDANKVDDDACGNDCAPSSCGDGKLQVNLGEVCDDGNKDDGDACLSTCVAASCGDGQVQAGVEACDDGDGDEADACTTLCKAPACDDKLESGAETDVDCGGDACADCKLGQGCLVDTDCESAACAAGECVVPQTCKQIKAAQPAAKDGVYTIDPDGAGENAPFDVYCDMTVDGGGWISLVHISDLSKLNYSLPHTQVAVSEATKFWIFAEKATPSYGVMAYNGLPAANYQATGPAPTDTGWNWNGVPWNNPPGCHVVQQMILVQAANIVPRSYGNPHYNGGQAFNAALTPVALTTASTIDVAPVANFPSIHIGCVGWNVLKDPILWIR